MFTELASQWTDSLTLNEDQAKLRRIIFGSAERIEADSAGRIRVPQEHLDQAEIGSAVAVVGAGSWLEIRDQQQWRDERRRLAGELPGLIERTRSSE
ncbi:MAG: division/cell wall cluster transcriptional repressor MraZ [Planctomycetota bacterium]